MDDRNRKNSGYNWTYSGEDVNDFRSKYSQGFDPDYIRHTEERRLQEEERRQKQRAAKKKPASRRQKNLFRQQRVAVKEPEEIQEEKAPVRRKQAGTGTGTARRKQEQDGRQKARARRSREFGGSRSLESARKNSDKPDTVWNPYEDLEDAGFAEERKVRTSRRKRPVRSRTERAKMTPIQRGIYAIILIAVVMLILLIANRHRVVITLNGDDPLIVGYGEVFTDPGATAEYRGTIFHLLDREVAVTSSHDVDSSKYGTYQILYHAVYKDKEANATRDVVIKDKTPPVLELDESANVVMNGQTWADSYTATDDKDGDITGMVKVSGQVDTSKNGTYEINYSVSDSAGNTVTATRRVIVSNIRVNNPSMAEEDGSNVIYLTFDDGPGPYTKELLDTLAKYNVKATFFVADRNPECEDLIKEEVEQGHTVGNHTASADLDVVYADENSFWEDYDKMDAIIEAQTGSKASIMRFPGGSTNTIGVEEGGMAKLIEEARGRGLRYFDWTIICGDSGSEYSVDSLFANIRSELDIPANQRYSILMVLCHDQVEETVQMMNDLIPWALENGFVFMPITDDTPDMNFHTVIQQDE